MFSLQLKNKQGDTLEFTQANGFTIAEIQGLNPPSATINTSALALIDGGKFNSSKVNMRTIELAFYIELEAAKKRLEVYKVLKSKQYVEVHYKGDYRSVFIEGFISSINIDYFAMKQLVTVSILCPSPYFKEAQYIVNELSSVVGAFTFPFAITTPVPLSYLDTVSSIEVDNKGDVETGLIIELYARGTVVNPKVFDYVTGEYIGINFTLELGDLMTIDTRKGEKSITLLRDGVYTNKFNTIVKGSKWLQLAANGGVYTAEAEEGFTNLLVTLKHYDLYEGV